jgi:hypothetical protein
MNIQRFQVLALILSAVCVLLGLTAPDLNLFAVSAAIGIILFMLGIPAFYSTQPSVWVGLAGIAMLEIAALIALGFRLNLVSTNLGKSLSETSAILGVLGALIIGWVTTKEHVFPAWVGWVFMIQGLLNYLAGLFNFGSWVSLILVIFSILYAVSLFAYGYLIYRLNSQTNSKFGNHA